MIDFISNINDLTFVKLIIITEHSILQMSVLSNEDILIHIIKMLKYTDLIQVRLVCKLWHVIVEYVKDRTKTKYLNSLPYNMMVPMELRVIRKLLVDHHIIEYETALSILSRLGLSYYTTIMVINGQLIIKAKQPNKTFILDLNNIDTNKWNRQTKTYYIKSNFYTNDNDDSIWLYDMNDYMLMLVETKTTTLLGYTHDRDMIKHCYDYLFNNFDHFTKMKNSGMTIVN